MFEIYMGTKAVGTARVSREGLYYRFDCTCKPPDSSLYRIWVTDGTGETDLGICVPDGGVYTLTKRLPVKGFRGETFSFSLRRNEEKKAPPIPLEMLEQAVLCNGQILIKDPIPAQPDSDPSPEYPHKWEQP